MKIGEVQYQSVTDWIARDSFPEEMGFRTGPWRLLRFPEVKGKERGVPMLGTSLSRRRFEEEGGEKA